MSENTHDTNTVVDMERLETLLTDIAKSITDNAEAPAVNAEVEVIAKGADQLLAQAKESNEALSKSFKEIEAKIDALQSSMEALATSLNEKVEKGLAQFASEPVISKAIKAEPELAPADQPVAAPAITKDDVLHKCIKALETAQGDRKAQLLTGIAKLDSHFAPAEVAAELNL